MEKLSSEKSNGRNVQALAHKYIINLPLKSGTIYN